MQHPRFRDGPLHWLYYWLDLFGPDGAPSNGKILVATGYYSALPVVLAWGVIEAFNDGVGPMTVAALGMVLGMAFGLDGFKSRNKTQGGDDGTD